MREVIGTNNRIIEIDLTPKKFSLCEINKKDREVYLGGKGLGLKLSYYRIEQRTLKHPVIEIKRVTLPADKGAAATAF